MSKERRLRWYLARATRFYRRDLAKARKENADKDARDELQHGYWAETDELQQELEALRTERLVRQAHWLNVLYSPIPWHSEEQRNDYWVQGSMTGKWYLTAKGHHEVETAIWAKMKARHEVRALWIPWIVAITAFITAVGGVVGALIGLFSILKK
jgi:hypothetical protein